MEKPRKGYCVKYDPKEVLKEYENYITLHHKADHAVFLLSRKYLKSRRTIYSIIKSAKTI